MERVPGGVLRTGWVTPGRADLQSFATVKPRLLALCLFGGSEGPKAEELLSTFLQHHQNVCRVLNVDMRDKAPEVATCAGQKRRIQPESSCASDRSTCGKRVHVERGQHAPNSIANSMDMPAGSLARPLCTIYIVVIARRHLHLYILMCARACVCERARALV